MGRPKKTDVMDQAMEKAEEERKEVPIEEMPLKTLRDYRLYNERARAANKKLRQCRYKIKQCPVDLHPTERIVFNRNDQPENPLPVYVSNDMIEFKKTLVPGQVYDLPVCVVHYLAEKGVPVWKKREMPDGSIDTFIDHKKPRFALRTIYDAA